MFEVFKFVQLLQRNIISIDLIPCDSRCQSIPRSSLLSFSVINLSQTWNFDESPGKNSRAQLTPYVAPILHMNWKLKNLHDRIMPFGFTKHYICCEVGIHQIFWVAIRRHCCDCQHTLPVLTSHSSHCVPPLSAQLSTFSRSISVSFGSENLNRYHEGSAQFIFVSNAKNFSSLRSHAIDDMHWICSASECLTEITS